MIDCTTLRQNFYSPKNYRLVIDRLPHVEYFATEVNIPGLTINPVTEGSPFRTIYRPGDKVEFGTLDITFLIDEDLNNYQEIFSWMIGLTYPNNFSQYANLIEGDGLYSDASVITQNAAKTSNIEFKFNDIFPISLGQIVMNQQEEDVTYASATVTFQVNEYTITPLT